MPEETQIQVQKFTTNMSQWSNAIIGSIGNDYKECGVEFDEYSRKCAVEAMSAIYTLIKSNPKVNMGNLDKSNLQEIVMRCASLKLNPNAYPAECYFQLRNTKTGVDENGKDSWTQIIEMGVEGAGNDAILTNYGKDVAKVYPCWVIKEGDKYTPPKHKGIEVTPPEWEEMGLSQKAIRVVYPVKLIDNTVVYLSADRESVRVNLFAHVRSNMMNETFGIIKGTKKSYNKDVPRTRYDATPEEKAAIDAKKHEIYKELNECATLDDMLKCESAQPFISAAWKDTPESMIIRKMKNNAIKQHPKNYDPMASRTFKEMDATYQEVKETIEENANVEEFLIE